MNHADQIREGFAALRAEGKRHKEAAEVLGLSEGEAVAAHVGEHERALQALPLRPQWKEILKSLEPCGPLLALTRNRSTVHEKTGVYKNISGGQETALALGEEIDLRLFFGHWHAGFLVREAAANAGQPASLSMQFFDGSGLAVHKIHLREASDRAAFEKVAEAHAEPALRVAFSPAKAKTAPRPDDQIDREALAAAWAAMTDTHQFFGLLNKFEVERQQSFRLSEGGFTRRADRSAIRELLDEAAFSGAPIMAFVGSPGCIQIHSGPVQRVEPMQIRGVPWLNVLDPGFNLHLREDLIDRVWIVEKPTSDGMVTSVEAFDDEGELMAMFFGARKPGVPEREDWRALVRKLPEPEVAA